MKNVCKLFYFANLAFHRTWFNEIMCNMTLIFNWLLVCFNSDSSRVPLFQKCQSINPYFQSLSRKKILKTWEKNFRKTRVYMNIKVTCNLQWLCLFISFSFWFSFVPIFLLTNSIYGLIPVNQMFWFGVRVAC